MAAAEEYIPVLPALAQLICERRKEAVEGRNATGLESIWAYATDAYNGEDETTKHKTHAYKPQTLGGPFISPTKNEGWQRSTAFFNLTRPYVDAAAAKVSDMLFPTDERNFELSPTPMQDVEGMLDKLDELPDDVALQAMEQVKALASQAVLSVEKAQRKIDDWLTEIQWNGVGRRLVEDAARIGTGVVKGPVPMKIDGKIQPGSKIIDVRNCYPDPDCGEDIHDGEYFFEREEITARKLREKQTMSSVGWIPSAIKECLEEGPQQYNGVAITTKSGQPTHRYELWNYQGSVPVEALIEAGRKVPTDAGTHVWANVVLCNERIVKISVSAIQDRFSYDMLTWQMRDKCWAGVGIAEQLETPQRGINAAIRNLFDNAALSSLPQIIYWYGVLSPVNGRFELEPGKQWRVADEDRPLTDVKNAILFIDIPNHQAELERIIALMRDAAQEVTGIPLIIRGQSSSGAVGSDQLQTNAATTVLRRLAKNFDDQILKPHLSAYYRWIREFDVIEVSEATVNPRGSSVLVERDIQAQALISMVQLSKDPTYGLDPELVAEEWVKSQKFDPRKLKLSPERREQLQQLMSQPDEKAQATVESSKLRAEALTKQTETEAQVDIEKLKLEQSEAERKREHDKEMLDLQTRYKLIEYALQAGVDIKVAQQQLNETTANAD